MFVRLHSQTWQGCVRPRGIKYMYLRTDKERMASIIWLLCRQESVGLVAMSNLEKKITPYPTFQIIHYVCLIRGSCDTYQKGGKFGVEDMENGMQKFCLCVIKEWLCVGWTNQPGILVFVCGSIQIQPIHSIFNSCVHLLIHTYISVSLTTYHVHQLYNLISWSAYSSIAGRPHGTFRPIT